MRDDKPFLAGVGGPGIPQPPEYPQPARPQGLPRWQTECKNMIDDSMLSATGQIGTEQDLEAVKNRLRYLEKYQPNLAGEMLTRCKTAIELLKQRVKEYKYTNINEFIKLIANFVSSPIRNPGQLVEAQNYLSDLTSRRLKLAGEYARSADLWIGRLKERIKQYQEANYV